MEPQQQQALALLVSGKSVDEISGELDIHRTTLWRWRKQPDFIAGWNQMRSAPPGPLFYGSQNPVRLSPWILPHC